ncbi:Hydroxymethylglutaryl-coenzyme A reductase [Paragonimus heterotremus]|uniref:Hydroxymethylglutaryl-coenzyme A reductase n=1 Tax=Paragonimus heterotremus TaxID=100268 RepID=A0A8J4WER0_9TREM|nr:Hydroxymethylglutaryl-coenzyme A reductase [Paragonimus heterotremus]
MEVSLRAVAIPNCFFVISIGFLICMLDRIFSQIENFVYTTSADKHIVSPLSFKNTGTILCTSFFCVICMSTAPALLFLESCSALEVCAATGLFLASTGTESFLSIIQGSLMCYLKFGTAKFSGGLKLGGDWRNWVSCFYCIGLCRYIASSGKLLNFLLKIVCFGVGATSGYPLFEDVCLICITQLLSYAFILFVIVRPSVFLYAFLKTKHGEPSEHNDPRCSLHTSTRKRSRSCSVYEATYPERRPVSVQTVLQKTVQCANPLPTQHRIKCLTVIGLFLMYLHNFYFIRRDDSLDTSSLTLPAHCPVFSFYSGKYSTANRSPETFWRAFHYTDLNLLLVLFAGILFYYRARIFASQRGELLNLNVDNKESSQSLDRVNPVLTSSSGLQIEKTVDTRTQRLVPGRLILEAHPETKNLIDAPVTTKDCLSRLNQLPSPFVSDNELLGRLAVGTLKTRELESVIGNPTKAVELRRMDLCRLLSNPHVLERLPFRDYDYRFVNGQCCEEVIGYLPLPVGKVGPLLLDGHSHYIPLATTEGCLVASTNRGCRALFLAGGVSSVVFRDQMTRAPVVWFPSVLQVVECITWIESAVGYQSLKTVFDRTSAHINLISVFPNPVSDCSDSTFFF